MSKQLYQVQIIRRDGMHLMGFESENFDEAKEKWKEFQTQWVTKFKDTEPFVLEDPIVTAFDPGLILEISIVPVSEENKEHNPYKEAAQKKGLQDALAKTTTSGGAGTSGVFDQGYR